MINPRAASYEAVPYEDLTIPESHPNRLSAVASLFGLATATVGRARVLELGCAGGGNLLPMALAAPGAQFTGIDLSPGQIDDAQGKAERLGLANVSLRAMSVADLGPEAGAFDYIIAHGLYSWVGPAIQEATLAAIRRLLAPEGVAFVSYNTYPGWHLRGIARELMVYHVRAFGDPREAARQARAVLEGLAEVTAGTAGAYPGLLREEWARVKGQADAYLHHEYLEAENNPVYFHEFAARASSNGLRYVAESRFRAIAANQPAPVLDVLDRLAGDDLIAREQYFDFLCNRYFRGSLLVHEARAPRPRPSPEGLASLRVLAIAGAPTRRDDPASARAMATLSERWPRSVPFEELRGAGDERLGEAILRLFAEDAVDLLASEPDFAAAPSDRPISSPLARLQAETGPRVTNFRHRVVTLGAFERLLIRLLDGRRDRAALLDAAVSGVADAGLTIQREGRPIAEPAEVRAALAQSLESGLKGLAANALLVG